MKYVRDAVKEYSLQKLNESIMSCHDCNCNCAVKTIGSGNINGTIMIIGDYPGQEMAALSSKVIDTLYPKNDEEIKMNVTYEVLSAVFKRFQINTTEIFFMNCVNCCPVNIVDGKKIYKCPNSSEIEKCSTFMKYAVDVMHPAIIILLGNVALNCFKRESINKVHGTWINAFTIPAMPIYSPNFIHDLKGQINEVKRNQLMNEMLTDFKNAFLYLQKKYPNNKATLASLA